MAKTKRAAAGGLTPARADSGRIFYGGASGRWAGERLMRAMMEGREISPKELRTNDLLRKNEWEHLDEALVEEGHIRLKGVADLMSAGLTIPVPNAMGKTIVQWETVTDMEPAETSLAGVSRTDDDRVEFDLLSVPLPITHKDFNLHLRHLQASRNPPGEPLDTTQARVAGRLVSERLENMLFQGGPTFGGHRIYGYTNHPQRNTGTFSVNAWNDPTVTGEDILRDVLAGITVLEADRFFGPYWLYIPGDFSVKLDEDFKANSDKTIRQRLMEVDRLNLINTVDQLQNSNVILHQATKDVVALVEGEPLQSVQWDIEGGFIIKFKAFQIAVPLIRADHAGRSGVYHLS